MNYSWTHKFMNSNYELQVHEPHQFHELGHFMFMNMCSWTVHEYVFMNCSWICVHELFMNCSRTINEQFKNHSWTVHDHFTGASEWRYFRLYTAYCTDSQKYRHCTKGGSWDHPPPPHPSEFFFVFLNNLKRKDNMNWFSKKKKTFFFFTPRIFLKMLEIA